MSNVCKTIFKYHLDAGTNQSVLMPIGAMILALQMQHGTPMIWALVNPDHDTEERRFLTFGTGYAIAIPIERLEYIGTYQMHDGALVLHVFEERTT